MDPVQTEIMEANKMRKGGEGIMVDGRKDGNNDGKGEDGGKRSEKGP